MGKRFYPNQKCGVFGCTLPNLHAGMHETSILCCNRHGKRNDINKYDKSSAIFRNSPSLIRHDCKESKFEIELNLVKPRLMRLRKELNDLCQMLGID